MSSPNWDALGMRPTKPVPPLFIVNYQPFQRAIDWLARELALRGYPAARAVLDPPLEMWRFYDHAGDLVVNIPHDLVERVLTALLQRHEAEDDAA